MEDLTHTIEKIPEQIKRWHKFGIWAPTVFLAVGSTLLLSNLVEFNIAFMIGVSLIAMTTFTWWVWIIYSISQLSKFLINTHKDINIAIAELKDIKAEVDQERKNVKK